MLEEDLFPRPAVRRILTEKFVEARLHTDHETLGEEHSALQRRFVGFVANPYLVVYDPVQKKALRRRGMTRDPAKLADFLAGVRTEVASLPR